MMNEIITATAAQTATATLTFSQHLDLWHDFYVVLGGASATLMGLLFVAISLNADLITLHVYSPPLLTMGTYSLTDNLRGEEPMLLDFYDAAGI